MALKERLRHERAFFNRRAMKFNQEKIKRWFKDRINWPLWKPIHETLGSIQGKLILDLGCGLGFDTFYFTYKEGNVIGLDLSEKSIEKAKAYCKEENLECEFIVGSAEDLPFKNNSFDVVFGRAILHHLDVDICLNEARRVMKGKCLFIEPLALNPIVNFNRNVLDKYDRTRYEERLILSSILKKFSVRFKKVRHKEYHLISPASFIFKKIFKSNLAYKYSFRLLDRLDNFMLRTFPALRNLCWITIISGE